MRTFERFLMTVVGVGLIGAQAATAAADCESDADCGPGQVCNFYEVVYPDCDLPDCDGDDEECAALLEKEQYNCDRAGEVVIESYCDAAPCEVDADCGDGLVCIEYVDEWCEGSADGYCDETGCYTTEETENCGEDVYRQCGYTYERACEVDADCGEGFNCVPQEICWCTDGDVDGAADDVGENIVADPMPTDSGCGCELTGENYCQLQEIACDSDADCPFGLACVVTDQDTGEDCIVYEDGSMECWNETDQDTEQDTDQDCIVYDDGSVECAEPLMVEPPPVVPNVSGMCYPSGWYGDSNPNGDGEDMGGDTDVDADTDADTDTDDGDDDGDNIFDDVNIGIFFDGCSIAVPAAKSAGFGLMEMFSLLKF